MTAVADRVKELVVRTLHRYSMLRFGGKLGVAVSGGGDSVCLLGVLGELAGGLGLQLTVLHVNHGLRGAESDADERFVAALAAQMGLAVAVGRLEAGALRRGNLEQNARRARLRLFERFRQELGLDAVALGHTRSDQAETVLMRLIRGSGVAGLAGILPVTEDGRIRPLIEVSRGQARRWLEDRGLAWREDSSNLSEGLLRNRVRGELLPRLERENPRIEAALARLALLAREEDEAMTEMAGRLLGEASKWEGEALLVDTGRLAGASRALARRALRLGAGRVLGGLEGVDLVHLEELADLAAGGGGGEVSMPRLTAAKSLGWLRMQRRRAGVGPAPEAQVVAGLGRLDCPWAGAAIELVRTGAAPAAAFQAFTPGSRYNEGRHILNSDLAPLPFVIRPWRHGDRYQPDGALREYTLHELFQRARIPRWERGRWPVLESGGRIVWARRFGVAQWAAARPGASGLVEVKDMAWMEGPASRAVSGAQ